jgi:hypothetical protein
MGGELHDGVVAFRALSPGRESIVLGKIPVGEIGPVHDPRSLYPVCFRIGLPYASSSAWMPARSIEDARAQAVDKIGHWLDAAGLMPTGGFNDDGGCSGVRKAGT